MRVDDDRDAGREPAPAPALADLLDEGRKVIRDVPALISTTDGEISGEAFLSSVDRLRKQLRSIPLAGHKDEPVAVAVTGAATAALVLAHAALAEGWAYSIRSPLWPETYLRAADARVAPTAVFSEPDILAGLDEPARNGSAGSTAAVPDSLLSHLLFTSGSTGAPRAIATERCALANHLAALQIEFGLQRSDVVLQLAPTHLDASLRDLLLPSLVGTRIVTGRRHDGRVDIVAVAEQLLAQQVTTILSVLPSVLFEIASQLSEQQRQAPAVRLIAVSGETLAPRALSEARRAFPNAVVVNQYGPSETTMTATRLTIAPGAADESRGARVGTPYPGYWLRIEESTGIVHVAGAGVARGYLADPRATAAAFLPDPAGRGSREYCTGDLGQLAEDGSLVLGGRSDDQVKVHGYRFSVSAVAAALETLPSVLRAATLHVTPPGQPARLLAAVVGVDASVGSAEYQRQLAELLPYWMLPSAIEVVASLPLLANGKLDRRAMVQIFEAAPGSTDTAAPTTPAAALRAIWQRLLKRRDLQDHDDFFLMGGNSLLALKVISESRTVVPELTVKAFFAEPTIEGVLKLAGSGTGNAS